MHEIIFLIGEIEDALTTIGRLSADHDAGDFIAKQLRRCQQACDQIVVRCS